MRRRRVGAGATALLSGALVLVGCGLGPGSGLAGVRLTVTHDYGAVPVLERALGGITESDTVMRVLEGNANVSTQYGGGFVQSIDGVEGGQRGGASFAWFFYVNGVESPVGAAAYALHGDEAIWWDYRDWSAAMSVPAVVGSWPEPFAGGYEGKKHPVLVRCLGGGGACGEVASRLAGAGAALAARPSSAAIRVLVGPWGRLGRDRAAAQIEQGPQVSGVYADFARRGRGFRLRGLGEDGKPVRLFGPDAGLVAATRRFEEPPTWIISGANPSAVRGAAGLLGVAQLRDHYAVAIEAGKETPLPLR